MKQDKMTSDEEAALEKHYLSQVDAFLAGCDRYRPIVEELLEVLKRCSHVDVYNPKLLARAEKLLGKKGE